MPLEVRKVPLAPGVTSAHPLIPRSRMAPRVEPIALSIRAVRVVAIGTAAPPLVLARRLLLAIVAKFRLVLSLDRPVPTPRVASAASPRLVLAAAAVVALVPPLASGSVAR